MNFEDIIVKVNAPELLRNELSRIRKKGTIGTGAMSDPYVPVEKEYKLMRRCLEIISEFAYPVHICTKSNLVLRDIDILTEINKLYACVTLTVTTADDKLAEIIEPNAPLPSDRFKALGILSAMGIRTGITMMPILPFIEDNEENIENIVKKAADSGVMFIYPAFGMTLRDRQRLYYYEKLDIHFPGIRDKYEKSFGQKYSCSAGNMYRIKKVFYELCSRYGIETGMHSLEKENTAFQLNFLNNKKGENTDERKI